MNMFFISYLVMYSINTIYMLRETYVDSSKITIGSVLCILCCSIFPLYFLTAIDYSYPLATFKTLVLRFYNVVLYEKKND